jgi:ATP-dependent Clp protease adapter protein ClpS
MPTFSESLELSLQRAIAIAGAGHHEYTTLEHLLLALIDDAEAAAVLRACNVDRKKLRRKLASFIDSELAAFEIGMSEDSKPSAAFQRVVQRAVTHVQSTTRREEVTAANVLVAILTERGSQASAALEEQAMTRYDAMLYICHGISKADRLSPRRTEAAPRDLSEATAVQAKVLLVNDDYTSMEFVVHVLERVFEKDRETAQRIMFETHNNGIGTCGLYPYDVAVTKVSQVLDLAREQQHPLQCVLEQSASI